MNVGKDIVLPGVAVHRMFGYGPSAVKPEGEWMVTSAGNGDFGRLVLIDSARVPLLEPQRRWLLILPAAALALDLAGDRLPYSLLAGLTVAFVIGSWVVTLRMAARCLLASASGARTRAERSEADVPPGLVGRLIVLWLLAMAPASAVLTGASAGLLLAVLALLVLVALTPATLVLSRTVSLVEALDPLNWRELLSVIGWRPCLKLASVLFALAAGYLVLAGGPLPEMLAWSSKGVLLAYWFWATVAWFDLAGRLLYEPPDRSESVGMSPEVVEELFERVMRQGGAQAEHRRLADALVMAGDRQRLLEHGRAHINALLEAFDRPDAAVEAASGLLAHDPPFCLDDTESMYRLVRASLRHGYPSLTIQLAGNYIEGFPRSFKCDEVRLIACEAAAGGGRDERRMAADWLIELIGAPLAADQRSRLKRIVPAFHAEGLIRRDQG